MNNFIKYIDGLINTTYLTITYSGEKSNALNHWMVKSEWRSSIDYTDNYPVLSTDENVLPENELLFQSQEKIEKSWRYYIFCFCGIPFKNMGKRGNGIYRKL